MEWEDLVVTHLELLVTKIQTLNKYMFYILLWIESQKELWMRHKERMETALCLIWHCPFNIKNAKISKPTIIILILVIELPPLFGEATNSINSNAGSNKLFMSLKRLLTWQNLKDWITITISCKIFEAFSRFAFMKITLY